MRSRPLRSERLEHAGLLLVCALALAAGGCVPPQLLAVRSGLDSLRAVVDTMVVRDAAAYRVLDETRREVAEQKDILLSTRAASGTTTRELFDQMSRLETRLEEVMGRFQQVTQRTGTGAGAPVTAAPDARQLYDQATQDLTQGRYALALQGYREYLRRFPSGENAGDAQYGAGECWFAEARYDSALTEYTRVEALPSAGDRLPSALYKRALCEDRLGRAADSRKTLEELVRRFPLSGEATLARERLGRAKR